MAFHKERPRAFREEPREPENPLTWSSRLIRSSSLNRPPSHVSAVRAPDGMSTTVIDYLLPITRQQEPCPERATKYQPVPLRPARHTRRKGL